MGRIILMAVFRTLKNKGGEITMNTENGMTQETRRGIVFTAHIIRGGVIKLFVEGLEDPVYVTEIRENEMLSPLGLVDRTFDSWVSSGFFEKTITDPELLSVLKTVRVERAYDAIPWYERTFRFLPTKDCTHAKPRFILTSDKSDVSDPERIIHR